jgi:hypothetical protein
LHCKNGQQIGENSLSGAKRTSAKWMFQSQIVGIGLDNKEGLQIGLAAYIQYWFRRCGLSIG